MFELVSPYELKFNKNYKIVGHGVYKGNYTGIFYESHGERYILFDSVYNIGKQKYSSPLYCYTSLFTYYRFVSDNPQWQMERRSVNMIVRKLLGDDCFEW